MDVNSYVASCPVCQHVKGGKQSVPLKPLEVLEQPWEDISYNMIVKLPKSGSFDSILVVVDQFSKLAHLLPCWEAMTAKELAKIFLQQVWKLHGMLKTTVSDRGTTFQSNFLQELYKLLHIKPKFSTAFQPKMDSQMERVNRWLEGYLRVYINFRQDDWCHWLPIAEFVYNNSVN